MITCIKAGSSYDDIAQLQETDERKDTESEGEKVVLEDGLLEGETTKGSNFFHSIGLDGGFGKPEYLNTDTTDTIFEERSMEEAAEEETHDEESEEANDDFEDSVKKF